MLKRTPATHHIMKRVDSLTQVPLKLRPLYQADHDADYATTIPFKLSPAGGVLRRLREHQADDDGTPLGGRTSHLTKQEFSMLLGVAEAHERPELVRAAARGLIKIEG